jgi:hypothetical protein
VGWEYSNYKATCAACGHEGVCIKGIDDWCRSSTSWEGFKNHAADPNDIGRKRADSRDSRPECECGSRKIIVGDLMKD